MLIESLENGLEYLLKENHFSRIVAIHCWVGTGSLFEEPHERGMAHLMEHMLFKGTPTRAVGEISREVEAAGGDINAYTTFDATVFYLTLSSDQFARGIELLADAVFNSSFDATELEKEKEVVIEEIKRSLDSPASMVGRAVFRSLFQGTEAGRPIIGSVEDVQGFQREDLVRFHQRWYHPENIKLVVVGDFDTEEMAQCVERHFGMPSSRRFEKASHPQASPLEGLKFEVIKGDYQQPRIELAMSAPPLEHPDTIPLNVVSFALGSGESSRLVRKLRDEDGIVNSIGCSLYSPKFGGVFEVSVFPVLDRIEEVVKSLAIELAQLPSAPVRPEELEKAKATLKIERIYQDETATGQARTLGHSLFTSHKIHYDDVFSAILSNTTATEINRAVTRWITPERATIVALVPTDSAIDISLLERAYQSGLAEARAKELKPARWPLKQAVTQTLSPEVREISPGVRLIYRRNPATSLFTMVAVSEGGLRYESEETAGIFHATAAMLANATDSLSYEALLEIVDGMGASLHGFSGKDSYGINLQCITEHADRMIDIFADCLLRPKFPEDQWQVVYREVLQSIKSEGDSPANIAIRSFQDHLFGTHPYRFPIYGLEASVGMFSTDSLMSFYQGQRDAGPWTIGCVGSFPVEWVVEKLSLVLRNWNPSQRPTKSPHANDSSLGRQSIEKHITKDREQVHIVVGTGGLSWASKEREALDCLGAILGGTSGRLFSNLRDRDALAYTVSPLLTYGCDPGILGTYIACSPEKKERAVGALMREFEALVKAPPSAGELERAINFIVGNHEAEMQRGEAQAMSMALMSTFGIGHEEFMHYPARIKKVEGEAVRRVAARILAQQPMISVSVGP